MDALLVHVTTAFGCVLRATAQGVAAAAVILAVQAILRRRLPAQWQYGLWFIVLLRLALPWTPESPLSLFNVVSRNPVESLEAAAPAFSAAGERTQFIERPVASAPLEAALTRPAALSWTAWARAHGMETAALIWLAGIGVFAARVLAVNARFSRRVLQSRPLRDPALLAVLDDCKRTMGVRADVTMVATDAVDAPVLFGFMRPRVLFPERMLDHIEPAAFRYAVLHEMAHLRRYDILVNWLAAAVHAVHWFNPALWYVFHRMRTDRELACDALVLSRSRPEETQRYGTAILDLFEQTRRFRRLPGVIGILEDQSQLKRRITMIALFKKPGTRWSVLAALLAAALSVVTLTNARAQDGPAAARLRANCQNKLKQLGLVCKMFANENRSAFPRLNAQPGRLMFVPEEVYPEYLTDPNVMNCPAVKRVPAELIDDESYFYLGFATTNEEQGLAFAAAYEAAAKEGRTLGEDLPVPPGGPAGLDKIHPLREGIERFFITDINDPAASAMTQSTIPTIVERPGHHSPDGGNVLFMDGHVEFIKYPGKYPMTEPFIKALEKLDALSNLPPTPPPAPEKAAQPSGGIGGMRRGRGAAAEPPAVAETEQPRVGKGSPELESKLDTPVSLEFQDTHIVEVVDFLSQTYDLNIVLDFRVVRPPDPDRHRVRGSANLPPGDKTGEAAEPDQGEKPAADASGELSQTYVTDGRIPRIKLQQISLREAIGAILRPLSLDFEVLPNHIFVSTPQMLNAATQPDDLKRIEEERAKFVVPPDANDAERVRQRVQGRRRTASAAALPGISAPPPAPEEAAQSPEESAGAAAAESPGVVESEQRPAEKGSPKLEAKLDQPVSAEFEDTHIAEIADFISSTWDLNIVLDSRVIRPPDPDRHRVRRSAKLRPGEAAEKPAEPAQGEAPAADASGNPTQTYVTDGKVPYIKVNNVSLRELIETILRQLGLDFQVRPDHIFVSTPQLLNAATQPT